jgi:hypothetical protein
VHTLKRFQFPFHYAAYYIAWLLGVGWAARGEGWLATGVVLGITALQVVWQYHVAERTRGLFRMVLFFTLMGSAADTLIMQSGLIVFHANPFAPYLSPPWMWALWVNFAVVYYAVLSVFWGRYGVLAAVSLVSFPLVYLAGERLGAVAFPFGDASAIVYGAVWVWLMPLCDYLYQRQGRCHDH